MLKRISCKGKIVKASNTINGLGDDLTNVFPNLMKRLAAVQPIALDPDKYYYFRNRAVSAYETHSLNDNGDGFERDELHKKYATFINCPSSVDHITEDQVGLIIDSVYIPFKGVYRPSEERIVSADIKDMQPGDLLIGDWVENVHALDREVCAKNHPELIPGIESGQISDTSMGCYARFAICTVCGNVAYSEDQFCQCVKNSKGRKIVKAGTTEEVVVGELNKDIKFFEDTIVLPLELQGKAGGAGADQGAKILQVMSSLKPYVIIRAADEDEEKDDKDQKKEDKKLDKMALDEEKNKIGGVPDAVNKGMEQLKEERQEDADENEDKAEERVSDDAVKEVKQDNIAKLIVDKLSEAVDSIKGLLGKGAEKPKEEVKEETKEESLEIGGAVVIAKIVHLESGKWQVQSEKGRNMGTYDTKEEAEKRLRQVEFFKHKKGCITASIKTVSDMLSKGKIRQASLMTIAQMQSEFMPGDRVECVTGETGEVVRMVGNSQVLVRKEDGTEELYSASQTKSIQ